MSRPHLPKTRIDPATLPPLLMTSDPNSFAKATMEVRDIKILDDLAAAPYFSPDITRGFRGLRQEILQGTIQPLREDAPDTSFWGAISKPYLGGSWLNVPWYWAETYFYRRILEIVHYFQIGAWHERDPFGAQKDAELVPDAAPARVRTLLSLLSASLPSPEISPSAVEGDISGEGQGVRHAFELALHTALWGNRVDLSYNVEKTVGRQTRFQDERTNLLADDSANVFDYLSTRPIKHLIYVNDNAGTELALDLAFIDFLLTSRLAEKITLHLKPQPFYVSDAMPQDVERTLTAFTQANAETRALAERLRAQTSAKRLEMRVHWFYPTSLHYFEMPDDLFDSFRAADFAILKGDVNYRRVVGDAHWKPTISFEYATRYFPVPFVNLRTLKSDPIVGLTASQVDELNRTDREWRTNGKRGVIQANLKSRD